MKQKSEIDLNNIIQLVNITSLVSIWISFSINGINEYINLKTIILGSLLSFEIIFFLWIEKKRRDPFIIILCFQMVFFYLLRILTLSIYPVSFVFGRFPFNASNLNYAIAFIIAANMAIFWGLYLNKIKESNNALSTVIEPKKEIFVFFVLLFVYFMVFAASVGPLAILIGLINSLFVNVLIVILMLAIYIIIFYKRLSLTYKILLGGGLLVYIILSTLTGSRSAIISISYLFLLASLTIFNVVRVKKLYLIIALVLLPVLISFFTIATFLRPRLENRGAVGGETFEVLKDFDFKDALISADKEIILSPIFGRIAFLDFAAEVMANENEYKEVFKYKYYLKSVIDNVLTPGFDIFNTPRTSNALTFIYNGNGEPNKSKVSDAYQSDEFTLFGEYYLLFGKWFSLIPIFFTAFAFKRIYVKIKDANLFTFYVKRTFVLYIYFTLINSFGLDWLMFDIIGMIFTYLIFKNFFKFQTIKNN